MGATNEVPVVMEVSDVSLERGPNGEPASASGKSNLAFRDVCFEVNVRKGRTGEKQRRTIIERNSRRWGSHSRRRRSIFSFCKIEGRARRSFSVATMMIGKAFMVVKR